MKKIGIIGAMSSEVALFKKDFSAAETHIPGIYKGSFGEKEVYICLSGIGKVNAAIAAQKMIDIFEVEAIINSGIAGGISKDIAKMDIVISESLTYHDFNPLRFLDENAPYASVFKADKKLISAALTACERLNEKLSAQGKASFTAHCGTVVSGDCFVESAEKANYLSETFGALCTEMEGAAIAHTALSNKVPFVVIRAISDFADENAEDSVESFEYIAADRAAFLVKEILSSDV